MIGCLVELCKIRGTNVFADKSKVMVLGLEGGTVCEVIAEGRQL